MILCLMKMQSKSDRMRIQNFRLDFWCPVYGQRRAYDKRKQWNGHDKWFLVE